MKKRRILIVEDVPMISEFIELVLSRQGYRIAAIVRSGEEAVAATRTIPFDLVLMDIRLAGPMDGIETAESIRSMIDIPIVFVSAYTELDVIQRAVATGASGYIIKPFKGTDLLFAVDRAFDMPLSGCHAGDDFLVNHPAFISRTRIQVDR